MGSHSGSSRVRKQQLQPAVEVRWLQADGAEQQVDPLVGRELAAACPVLVEVEGGKLDRLEVLDPERAPFARASSSYWCRMSICAQMPPISSRSYSRR